MRVALTQDLGAWLRLAVLIFTAMLPDLARATPAPQAQRFQEALGALQAGDMARYRALADKLHGYILQPYLRFAYLRETLKTATPGEINAFLRANATLPIAGKLRHAWLLELARREDWTALLAADHAVYAGPRIACARARALSAIGRKTAAIRLAKRLWLVGYSQPKSCNPVFDLLRRNTRLPTTLVRERLVLALRAGHPRLALYLTEQLPVGEQTVARRWLDVYAAPQELSRIRFGHLGNKHAAAQVVTAGLLRMARKHPADTHALWSKLASRLHTHLSLNQRHRIERTIAVYAAIDGLAQGERWLAELPATANTDSSREWRARAALRAGDWRGLLATIRAMPQAQRDEEAWRFWEARALLQSGRIKAGRTLADALADEFSYYGFLAADLIQRPYARGPQPAKPDPTLQKKIARMRLARVALALHAADQTRDAGAAWRALLRQIKPRQRLAAARLANRQNWAYGAYTAAAQSGANGLSALTFPRAHWGTVRVAANDHDLSPDLVLALMRQESAFQSSVCSSAGACGLMQLLPSTACWIGERSDLGKRFCDSKRLSQASTSIRAGSAYLSYLMDRFADNVVAAVAAYNAGPGNVSQWLTDPSLRVSGARWIATLPFGETRYYIQAVLFNRVAYAQRAGSGVAGLRLSDLLGTLSQSSG